MGRVRARPPIRTVVLGVAPPREVEAVVVVALNLPARGEVEVVTVAALAAVVEEAGGMLRAFLHLTAAPEVQAAWLPAVARAELPEVEVGAVPAGVEELEVAAARSPQTLEALEGEVGLERSTIPPLAARELVLAVGAVAVAAALPLRRLPPEGRVVPVG